MIDLSSFPVDISLIVKAFILLLIGIYSVFVFITFTHIRSLNRIVLIEKALGSSLVQTLSLIYLIATISLFIAAVVIL